MKNDATGKQDGHGIVASQCRDEDVEGEEVLPSLNEEATSNADLASSSMGEVKVSQSCIPVLGIRFSFALWWPKG